MMGTIIIPDVHGRRFWESAVGYSGEVVFLGDYLAPYYTDEGITHEMAFNTFKDILSYAKNNDNVKLLLGNHDLEYMIGQRVCQCRTDYERYDEIRALFLENENLFNLCRMKEVNGRRIFLSHAGIHPYWFERNKDVFGVENYKDVFDEELINTLFHGGALEGSLCNVGWLRGGWSKAGSIVWADIREYEDCITEMYRTGVEQIVGHTRSYKDISFNMILNEEGDKFSCITCIDSIPHTCRELLEGGTMVIYNKK